MDRDSLSRSMMYSVSCKDKTSSAPSCLNSGWNVHDEDLGLDQEIICVKNNCKKNGWDIITENYKVEIRCKSKGCFVEGWYFEKKSEVTSTN